MAVVAGGREARTLFYRLARFDAVDLLRAHLFTGRTHQIRVHLAETGYPVIGDFKYGGAEARGLGEIADKLHLHARSIDIAHPDGGRLSVTAPLPEHMLKTWRLLGFDPESDADPFAGRKRKKTT
jgi:23S rRNA pseudouridine955/2504/2580 synthase